MRSYVFINHNLQCVMSYYLLKNLNFFWNLTLLVNALYSIRPYMIIFHIKRNGDLENFLVPCHLVIFCYNIILCTCLLIDKNGLNNIFITQLRPSTLQESPTTYTWVPFFIFLLFQQCISWTFRKSDHFPPIHKPTFTYKWILLGVSKIFWNRPNRILWFINCLVWLRLDILKFELFQFLLPNRPEQPNRI